MAQLNWHGTTDEWDAIKEREEKIRNIVEGHYDSRERNINDTSEAYKEMRERLIADEKAYNETKERIKNILNWNYGLLGKNINDPVSHPAHYTTGKIECIEYIEDKGLGFHLGNAVKYITRAGKKSPDKKIEDLRKAMWYIDRYIQIEEKREREEIEEMVGNRTE